MKDFHAPKKKSELVAVLAQKDSETWITAGGTDLAVYLHKNNICDYGLIDLSQMVELKQIRVEEGALWIGAVATIHQIEKEPLCKQYVPALVDACQTLGSTQIRNRATIGGNIANAAQCADMLPVLCALDATVTMLNGKGEQRILSVREFVVGINKTQLQPDEVLMGVSIPITGLVCGFAKVGAKCSVTISKLSFCVCMRLDEDVIQEATVYMGSVGEKPIRGERIEKALVNQKLTRQLPVQLQEIIRAQIIATIPTRQSRFYKKEAAIGVFEEVLYKIIERGEKPCQI